MPVISALQSSTTHSRLSITPAIATAAKDRMILNFILRVEKEQKLNQSIKESCFKTERKVNGGDSRSALLEGSHKP